MTVLHDCAFREHTSVHIQYRKREDVIFEGRVIRNCQENRWQGWGEPERLDEQAEGLG